MANDAKLHNDPLKRFYLIGLVGTAFWLAGWVVAGLLHSVSWVLVTFNILDLLATILWGAIQSLVVFTNYRSNSYSKFLWILRIILILLGATIWVLLTPSKSFWGPYASRWTGGLAAIGIFFGMATGMGISWLDSWVYAKVKERNIQWLAWLDDNVIVGRVILLMAIVWAVFIGLCIHWLW